MFMSPHVRPNHTQTIQNGAFENMENFRYSGTKNCMKEEIKGGLNSWNVFYHSDQNTVVFPFDI
jgi:hypothetical protein